MEHNEMNKNNNAHQVEAIVSRFTACDKIVIYRGGIWYLNQAWSAGDKSG